MLDKLKVVYDYFVTGLFLYLLVALLALVFMAAQGYITALIVTALLE